MKVEQVVAEQLSDIQMYAERYQPLLEAVSNLTQAEQMVVVNRIVTHKKFPRTFRVLLEGAGAILRPILYGKTLGTAFFENPAPVKAVAKAVQNGLIMSLLQLERSQDSEVTDNIKHIAGDVIDILNVVLGKLEAVLAALEETRECGNFYNSCPDSRKSLTCHIKSAVEDECIDYSTIRDYAKYMSEAGNISLGSTPLC